jgi:DNA-binding transcriptional regulator YiaG
MTHVPGFKCTKCGGTTIPGDVINDALRAAVIVVTRLPRRLGKNEAKFIRRTMGITQEDLARRIGVVRETVAKWETEDGPSAQHDLLLRVVALTPLAQAGWIPEGVITTIIPDLSEVRKEPPPLESLVPLDLGRHRGPEMRA